MKWLDVVYRFKWIILAALLMSALLLRAVWLPQSSSFDQSISQLQKRFMATISIPSPTSTIATLPILQVSSKTLQFQKIATSRRCMINGSAWAAIGGDRNWSVVFVDHRPGRRRPIDVERLLPLAQIVVAHDTQIDRYRWSKPTSVLDPNPFSSRIANLSFARRDVAMAAGGADGAREAFELAVSILRAVKNETENTTDEIFDLAKTVRLELDRADAQLTKAARAGYGTHRAFLLSAVLATNGAVLEMGVGDFSTHSLHRLVTETGRYLESAETDLMWMNRFLNMTNSNHVFRHVPVYAANPLSADLLNFDC